MSIVVQSRTGAMWRRCLTSAFRAALACTIVGAATLFGPAALTRQVAFPAFSYVTVVLVVTDATLGDTVRGCWLAVCACLQVVCPAILVLRLIGPGQLNNTTTAAIVAINGFFVALQEKNHLVGKRVALGQIMIVYVIGFINGDSTDPVMHPVHVAASTALGVAACVLALLVPYPGMATSEVRGNCKLYIENASERVKLYMKAFSAQDKTSANGFISQANSLNHTANKLLQAIKSKQESMKWERIPVKFFKKSYNETPGAALQGFETILKGMENALTNFSQFPVELLNPELKNGLTTLEDQILNQVKGIVLEGSTLPPLNQDKNNKFLQTLQTKTTSSMSFKDLPSLFFMFCLKLLESKSDAIVDPSVVSAKEAPNDNVNSQGKKKYNQFLSQIVQKKRLMPALKCSLSLGFAVLFGLIYSKPDGFWSGLPVAISLAPAREATFKVANIKAQGTVLGTVYGVLGCFIFEKYVRIRFISLIPWFIFCSFLRQSRMYGQAGGVSAVIGAVLILGRRNFGEPSDFAIARIVETFIGLSCSIMVDILLHPTRAAVLAKLELSTCLQALHETIASISLDSSSMEGSLKKLRLHVNEVGNLIEEAEVEPNFWFLPFHTACYKKLRVSLTRTVDFLQFERDSIAFLGQESRDKIANKEWKQGMDKLQSDLNQFKTAVSSGIKCFEELSLVKSLDALEKEYEKRNGTDLEMGKSGKQGAVIQWPGLEDDGGGLMKTVNSLLQHLDSIHDDEMKIQAVLGLSGAMYCLDGVVKEGREIEKGIQELVEWENPSRPVDLHDVLCKLNVFKKSVAV